jgi:hypothetical protein
MGRAVANKRFENDPKRLSADHVLQRVAVFLQLSIWPHCIFAITDRARKNVSLIVLVSTLIALIACKQSPQSIVIELSSANNVTISGTIASNGITNVVQYNTPTNLVISGTGIAVHLALQGTNGSCEIKWHPKSWETYPQQVIENYPKAILDQRKPFYHIAFKESKWFSGLSENEDVPWPDKR